MVKTREIIDFLGGPVWICTVLFILIYLSAWTANSLLNTKFDLPSLINMYQFLLPKIAEHFINSVWNSEKGKDPR